MTRWFGARMLGLHLLALACVGACVVMGMWQLGVYGQKHDDEAAAIRSAAPVDLVTVWGPDDPFTTDVLNRTVRVAGTFTGEQFRVRHAGSTSAWIVAPLRVDRTDSALLIVRGAARADGAVPEPPVGHVEFRAVLRPGEDGLAEYDASTRTLAVLSVPAMANLVHTDLFSGFALAAERSVTGGLTPVEPPDPHVSWTVGLRNLAYALQWWVFGLFAVFMWWRMVTDALAAEGPSVP